MVSYLCHFNSHAHVERDFINFTAHITHKISTHTLTWSVTVRFFCLSLSFTISTHTLTWSVTLFSPSFVSSFRDFNSHAHVERDI